MLLRPLALFVAMSISWWALLQPIRADAAGALTWPADPMALTSSEAGFTSSFEVTNPTGLPQQVTPAPVGAKDVENGCDVKVIGSGAVPARRQAVIAITVASVPGTCDDPVDGSHEIRFIDNGEIVALAIKKGATPSSTRDPTGLTWPTETVVLDRVQRTVTLEGREVERDALAGSFEVVNPTNESITVQPPILGSDCSDVEPPPAGEDPDPEAYGGRAEEATLFGNDPQVVPARTSAVIQFVVPVCENADEEPIIVVASATTQDGAKTDASKLTLQAKVDWGDYSTVLALSLLAAAILAVLTPLVGWLLLKEAGRPRGFPLGAKLAVDRSAPASWLTAIAAIGPLVTALASTAGLPKGLFGTDAIPQQTLVIGASAVALLLVGLSGVVANLPLTSAAVDGKATTCPYTWQFGIAAALSATAANLQLWAVTTALGRLDLPFLSGDTIGILQVGGAIAIAVYLILSIYHYFRIYGVKAESTPPPEPSDDLIGTIASALLVGAPDPTAERIAEVRQMAYNMAAAIVGATGTNVTHDAASPDGRFGITRNLI